MADTLIMTWDELKGRAFEIAGRYPKGTTFFGIPRGGIVPAQLIAGFKDFEHEVVYSPDEAEVIVDDIFDSGATAKLWQRRCEAIPMPAHSSRKARAFEFMVHKPAEGLLGHWIQFPWEKSATEDPEDHVRRLLEALGEDPSREGLSDTPRRYLAFLRGFTTVEPFKLTTFDAEGCDEMIVQAPIPFFSICEHHLAPFFGHAAVAYIPNGKIVGLSKLTRLVEKHSRRLQNQERITKGIANELIEALGCEGVAVSLRARHMCMEMRGPKTHDVYTTTTTLLGQFKEDPRTRSEYIQRITKEL